MTAPSTPQARSRARLTAFRKAQAGHPPEQGLAALRALPGEDRAHPDWIAEEARLLRLSGEYRAAHAMAKPLASQDPPHVIAAIEYAKVALALGAEEEALHTLRRAREHHADHSRLMTELLATLKAVKGPEMAEAEVIDLLRRGGGKVGARLRSELSDALVNRGLPELAAALMALEDDAGDPAEPLAYFAMARAAQALNETEKARQRFAEGVLALTPASLLNAVRQALETLLLPQADPTTLDRIIAKLHPDDISGQAAARRLAVASDDISRVIDLIAPGGVVVDATVSEVMQLLYALHDLGRYDDMRRHLAQDHLVDRLSLSEINGVIQVASCLDDSEITARLSALALERMAASPTHADALVLRAAQMAAEPDPAEAAAVLSGFLDNYEQGGLTQDLMYFLALNGAAIAAASPAGEARDRFERLIARLPNQLRALGDLAPVRREQRATSLMMRALGPPPGGTVSVIVPVHRAADLANIRRNLEAQTWPDIEAILIPNGDLAGSSTTQEALGDLPYVRILSAPAGTIGSYLNHGLDAATGTWIMRFDSDDTYLPDYIVNTLCLLSASGADLTYKPAMFMHMQALDLVLLQSEADAFLPRIGGSGATQAFRRDALEGLRYDERMVRSEDAQFARALVRAGGKIITAPPFDFVVTRHADKSRHTWHLGDFNLYGHRSFVGGGSVIPALGMPIFQPQAEP